MGVGLALLGRSLRPAGARRPGLRRRRAPRREPRDVQGAPLPRRGRGAARHRDAGDRPPRRALRRAMPVHRRALPRGRHGHQRPAAAQRLRVGVARLPRARSRRPSLRPTSTAPVSPLVAVPALALVGGLAAACFAKVFGTVFLGHPRSEHATTRHEPPASMLAPMASSPPSASRSASLRALLPALSAAAASGRGSRRPLEDLTAGGGRARAAARISLVARRSSSRSSAPSSLWRGARLREPQPLGARPGAAATRARRARMQYTGSSFAELARPALRLGLLPEDARRPARRPRSRATPPSTPSVPDTVLDVVIVPACGRGARVAERVRAHFVGRVQFQALLVVLGGSSRSSAGSRPVTTMTPHRRSSSPRSCSAPPLLLGVIGRVKAIFAGRTGPPLLQPYRRPRCGSRARGRSTAGPPPGSSGPGPVVGARRDARRRAAPAPRRAGGRSSASPATSSSSRTCSASRASRPSSPRSTPAPRSRGWGRPAR